MDNQTDSNDATWIWINPTISYMGVAHLTGTIHLKVHLFQCETCIMGIVWRHFEIEIYMCMMEW